MKAVEIAKNLLQDKTCDNCQGWTCPLEGEIAGTCENWKALVDLRINTKGNVGIGTVAPSTALHIKNAAGELKIARNGTITVVDGSSGRPSVV